MQSYVPAQMCPAYLHWQPFVTDIAVVRHNKMLVRHYPTKEYPIKIISYIVATLHSQTNIMEITKCFIGNTNTVGFAKHCRTSSFQQFFNHLSVYKVLTKILMQSRSTFSEASRFTYLFLSSFANLQCIKKQRWLIIITYLHPLYSSTHQGRI